MASPLSDLPSYKEFDDFIEGNEKANQLLDVLKKWHQKLGYLDFELLVKD